MWSLVALSLMTPAQGEMSAQLLAALTNVVTVTVSEADGLDVLSAADVERVVAFEAEKQAMGCEEAESCLAEVAGAMGARWIVFGDVGRIGSRYLVTLSLFDSDAGAARGREIGRADSEDALLDAATEAARGLVAELPKSEERVKVVVLKLRAAGGVEVSDEEEPPPAPATGGGGWLLWAGIGGVVAGGAVAGLGGLQGLQVANHEAQAQREQIQINANEAYDRRDAAANSANILFIVGGLVAAVGAGTAIFGVME